MNKVSGVPNEKRARGFQVNKGLISAKESGVIIVQGVSTKQTVGDLNLTRSLS